MTDYDRRNGGPRGGYNNRKRRFRDEDEFDRRPQRRRYEEPLPIRIRKQLLGIAESPLKKTDEEINNIAQLIVDHYDDEEIRTQFLELTLQLVVEQPLKTPFVAAIVLAINPRKPEAPQEVLARAGTRIQGYLKLGAWREVKLVLKFLACLQGLLEEDGVFPILEELFSRAVDLQTASSEDSLGLELVKIILLTIPYVMASSATGFEEHALAILDKTDVIASTPHALYSLVNPYTNGDDEGQEPQSAIGLLQSQLQAEAEQSWRLACIPRPWDAVKTQNGTDEAPAAKKHALPQIEIPSPVVSGQRPRLPEIFFSVYGGQEIETVPPISNSASSLIRDALIDTVNILDYNRHATSKFMIDVDCYFSANTFVKRATQFDKLREIEEGKSTWKPEDVVVDAVFSQLLQLPVPEHKLVYYHSVLTESCKIAPAAIAPSLGRAIRFMYQNVELMDLELVYRFMDWFAHHLSNFGFTWKWTEWVDDVSLPMIHPKKAFMVGALEKEIRLSFAARIRGTLPEPYRPLVSEAKEEDTPPFKYNNEQTPYSEQGRDVLRLLKTKAIDSDLETLLTQIQDLASAQGVQDPLMSSTDAYVTAICYLGSKSLSHVLSQIERCKDRLQAIGPVSEPARRQIITSVMSYWHEKPGVGVNVVDKLLNYTILTPQSVILWALSDQLGSGENLVHAHVYEMVASTVTKVTNRVRQIVLARNAPGLAADQSLILDETLSKEREEMGKLFSIIEDALVGVAEGSNDVMAEGTDQEGEGERVLREWGGRWIRVFRRKMAVEEAWAGEMMAAGEERRRLEEEREQMVVLEEGQALGNGGDGDGDGDGDGGRNGNGNGNGMGMWGVDIEGGGGEDEDIL